MSSRFAPGKKSAKTPAICIPPNPDLPPPYPDGEPSSLHVTAWWHQPSIGVWLAEYFQLLPDSELPGYSGSSGNLGDNLVLKVQRLPAADTYDVFLELREDEDLIDDDSWHGIHIDPGPPFDSGLLVHRYEPAIDRNGCQVMD